MEMVIKIKGSVKEADLCGSIRSSVCLYPNGEGIYLVVDSYDTPMYLISVANDDGKGCYRNTQEFYLPPTEVVETKLLNDRPSIEQFVNSVAMGIISGVTEVINKETAAILNTIENVEPKSSRGVTEKTLLTALEIVTKKDGWNRNE